MVFTEHQMLLFFLILVRMTSMVLSAPVFSSRGIPRMIKIGLSGLISLLLFPIVNSYDPQFAMNHLTVILLVFGEIFTGVMIGFSMRLLFAGVELAGEYIGVDMGFALAQVYDPNFNQQLSVIARLKNILAILIFLIIDGHHFLIEAVAYSYKVLPIGSWKLSSMAIDKFIQMSAQIFVIGIKIGAPALVALFLTSVAMGIIAR
nr:flagellar biosynthetic protein FliR [Calditrichia bacterium]